MVSGVLLQFKLSQVKGISGSLKGFALSQTHQVNDLQLSFGLSQADVLDKSLIKFGSSQYLNATKRRFLGSETIGLNGDYDVQMSVNGLTFDMCELSDKIIITHGENEAYTCQFTLQKMVNPRSLNGVVVDLYQWYGRKMTINIVHDGGSMRIYHGTITSAQPDFVSGKIVLTATDYRQRMIDKLPRYVVSRIGYTSKSAHGEFDNLSDELNKRLETVPASFEFDVYGNGYLNPWLPENPRRTMDGCQIYYRQPSARLAQVGEVVNRVNVSLNSQVQRLLQRSIYYYYSVGLTVCDYSRYGQLPDLEEFNDAVSQTGWELWGFDFERVAKSGFYNCPFGQVMHQRDAVTATANQSGSYASITRFKNLDVVSGDFEMVRRWTQNIGYQYDLVFKNRASIGRYGELSDNISYHIAAKDDDLSAWERDFAPHQDGVQYSVLTNDRLYFANVTKPFFNKVPFTRAENSDWYADLNQDHDELQNTLAVAYHTARTKMWASHRQNTIDLQVKFLPELSLKHSHLIDFKHIKALAKVAHFTHEIDLLNGLSSTSIQYRFFQNAAHDTSFRLPELDVPKPTFPKYSKRFNLGRTELAQGQQVTDKHFGVIYRLVTGRLYQGLGMRIYAPEIEQQSTDSVNNAISHEQEIGIPNQAAVFAF